MFAEIVFCSSFEEIEKILKKFKKRVDKTSQALYYCINTVTQH